MSEIIYMVKRNILVYRRDKSTVFFSMLSAIIVVILMFCFLGNMGIDSLTEILAGCGGARDAEADKKAATYLIRLWIMAGVIVVNSINVPFTILGSMVWDEEMGRARSFYVTGTSRYKLTIGYVLSAWIIGTIICCLTFLLGEVVFAATGYGFIGPVAAVKVVGIIMINSFVYSCIGYMISQFIHSNSAWSGFLTVVGAIAGFLGGTYISIGTFSQKVQDVLKSLPVLHGTALLRTVMTSGAADELFEGLTPAVREGFDRSMGNKILLHGSSDEVFGIGAQMLILAGYAIIPLVVAIILDTRRKLKDR